MEDKQTLAPPPINFRREYFNVNGKTYRVDYEHGRLTMAEATHRELVHGLHSTHRQGPNVLGCIGCMTLILSGITSIMIIWCVGSFIYKKLFTGGH